MLPVLIGVFGGNALNRLLQFRESKLMAIFLFMKVTILLGIQNSWLNFGVFVLPRLVH